MCAMLSGYDRRDSERPPKFFASSGSLSGFAEPHDARGYRGQTSSGDGQSGTVPVVAAADTSKHLRTHRAELNTPVR